MPETVAIGQVRIKYSQSLKTWVIPIVKDFSNGQERKEDRTISKALSIDGWLEEERVSRLNTHSKIGPRKRRTLISPQGWVGGKGKMPS